jgi:hypothetical protein
VLFRDNEVLIGVVDAISRALNQKPLVTKDKSIAFHEHTARWECGAIIGWNEPRKVTGEELLIISKNEIPNKYQGNATGKIRPVKRYERHEGDEVIEAGRIYICLPANALNRLYEVDGHWGWWKLFQLLDSIYGFKPTRLDFTMDDYDKSLDLWDVESALIIGGQKADGKWNLGNFTSFKSWEVIHNSDGGKTIYLGSRESDEYVRIYDKEIESKGKVKSIRMERVLKDERAEQSFNDLLNISPDAMETIGSTFCISVAIGKTKFINRTGWAHEKNISRIPVLPFWAEWTENIVPTGYSNLPVERTMPKTINWWDSQVIRSMVMVEGVMGEDEFENFFRRRLNEAKKRLTREQEHLMAQWKADYMLDAVA